MSGVNCFRTLLTGVPRVAAAVICLGVHLVFGTPVVALVTAAVAALDSDHTVHLASENGGLTLVLAHEAGRGAGPVHDHCLLAQCLVGISAPAGPGEADHHIYFGKCAPLLQRSASGRVTLAGVSSAPSLLASQPRSEAMSPAGLLAARASGPCSGVDRPVPLLHQSTVLLRI